MRTGVIVAGAVVVWLAASAMARALDPSLDDALSVYRRGGYAEALNQLSAIAARRDAEADYWIGAIYEKGEGVPRNLAAAARWYGVAANQGFAAAAFRLGLLYDAGRGVTANRATALQLYQAAAKLGHLGAMRAIGMAYEGGNGVERNLATALAWYHRAADHGDAEAFTRARRLALAFQNEYGLPPFDAAFMVFQRGDQIRALGHLLDASEAGDAEAMAWLGNFYENGYAGPKDFSAALKYYAAAAAAGSLKGKTDYATALIYGVGTKPDRAKALALLTEAAGSGFALAQYNLAFLVGQGGDGLPPDPAAARRWYRAAGLLGYEPAWDELKKLP
jgi:TPR repeat protein